MRKYIGILIAAGVFCAALIYSGLWLSDWWSTGRFEARTDNAYVRADVTSIAPKVAGYVTEVPVADNATVHRGDVLFTIDRADYKAKVDAAAANVASKVAALTDIVAQVKLQTALIAQADAQVDAAVADQTFTGLNNDRYVKLQKTGTASQQSFDQAQASKAKADAGVAAATASAQAQRAKIEELAAQKLSANAGVDQAKAALTLAQLDLDNTIVRSPVDGVVGNRQVRVGRYVSPGSPLINVVPLDNVWIVANFKETQLSRIKVGQNARVAIDGHAGADISGVVDSLSPGTGSTFSVLPTDNATGNFVRIVQRVGVKIRLNQDNATGRIVPGLSARVAVWTGDNSTAEK